MRVSLGPVSFGAATLLLSACGAGGNGAADATTPSADATAHDAAASAHDAGPNVNDAGANASDARANVNDAGVNTSDTGANANDTGANVNDAGAPVGDLPAEDYCETVAPFFCDFYVRCGRMAVDSVDACLPVFAAACNAGYEPQYVALASRGLLSLSAAGVEVCRAHLADVSCGAQVFDLDGGCAGMWIGSAPVGGACAPGIGSFVCAPGGTCVLGLDFCGLCEAAADTGAPCGSEAGDLRCGAADRCDAGRCVPRTDPGGACADNEDCVVAAACVSGVCRTFDRARAGEACGADRRCPYHSGCRDGRCEVNRSPGEACAAGDVCDAGRCADGVCLALRGEGLACTEDADCLSGDCAAGSCAAPLSACFPLD